MTTTGAPETPPLPTGAQAVDGQAENGQAEDGRAGDDDAPRYTVAAVARRLGVAPATLRTWARRYDLGPAAHAAGAHRRYSEADVRRLQSVRRVVQRGVTPAEAARLVRDGEVPLEPVADPVAAEDGGWVAPDDPEREVRGLVRAAVALDGETLLSTFRATLTRSGVVATWQQVLLPVLQAVGARWEATGVGVDVEHLVSDCAATALRAHAAEAVAGTTPGARLVLLACADGERHALPLSALAGALGERGVPSRVLGADVPREALAAAVRRIGPAGVFVWSSLPGTGDVALVESVPVTRPATTVVLGGPGWPTELPRTARRVHDLPGAVEELVALTR